jgi:hypothetical protein
MIVAAVVPGLTESRRFDAACSSRDWRSSTRRWMRVSTRWTEDGGNSRVHRARDAASHLEPKTRGCKARAPRLAWRAAEVIPEHVVVAIAASTGLEMRPRTRVLAKSGFLPCVSQCYRVAGCPYLFPRTMKIQKLFHVLVVTGASSTVGLAACSSSNSSNPSGPGGAGGTASTASTAQTGGTAGTSSSASAGAAFAGSASGGSSGTAAVGGVSGIAGGNAGTAGAAGSNAGGVSSGGAGGAASGAAGAGAGSGGSVNGGGGAGGGASTAGAAGSVSPAGGAGAGGASASGGSSGSADACEAKCAPDACNGAYTNCGGCCCWLSPTDSGYCADDPGCPADELCCVGRGR